MYASVFKTTYYGAVLVIDRHFSAADYYYYQALLNR